MKTQFSFHPCLLVCVCVCTFTTYNLITCFVFKGLLNTLLYNGSKFKGYQKSKGNSYEVEVILQFVDEANSYLCGYLKIKGLTFEFPTLTTFFDGEIISKRYPFLTRKWDSDEGKTFTGA